jgi:hypothetical protein
MTRAEPRSVQLRKIRDLIRRVGHVRFQRQPRVAELRAAAHDLATDRKAARLSPYEAALLRKFIREDVELGQTICANCDKVCVSRTCNDNGHCGPCCADYCVKDA